MKQLKLMSWNTRGLGGEKKCLGVRKVLRLSRCDVVCLQESKLNEYNLAYYSDFLPSFFEKDCVYIDAISHSGGCIITWRKNYTRINSWSTRHSCSVVLKQNNSGEIFTVTNVYGPSEDALKPDFLKELSKMADLINSKWMLVGDFNLVRWLIDRSSDMRATNLMDLFNELIVELQLVDVPLKNRSYTWCSKRPKPVFSRIDRCFMSPEWNTTFPIITLHAQDMMVSDHVPLILSCKHRFHVKRQPKMELLWLRHYYFFKKTKCPFHRIKI